MRLGLLALLICCFAQSALACRTAPHSAQPFRAESYVHVPGCAGQWPAGCSAKGAFGAWYAGPTTRYAHGVLGDAVEGSALVVYSSDKAAANSCGTKAIVLDQAHVFEDVAPRLHDADQDGRMDIIAVRSHHSKGAQLVVYEDVDGQRDLQLKAQTPYIGRAHRWLAPIGAADLDGDGHIEIAYVDRPHLAKTIRVWRFRNDTLEPVADLPGFSNHRIGEADIAGGIRHCGGMPEMIVATGDWARLVAVRLQGGKLDARDIGPHRGRASFAKALAC